MKDEIIKLIRNVSDEWSIKIDSDSKIFKELNFDQLDFIELLMDLEVKFNVFIPDNDYEKCQTVGDIVNLLASLLAGKTKVIAKN